MKSIWETVCGTMVCIELFNKTRSGRKEGTIKNATDKLHLQTIKWLHCSMVEIQKEVKQENKKV